MQHGRRDAGRGPAGTRQHGDLQALPCGSPVPTRRADTLRREVLRDGEPPQHRPRVELRSVQGVGVSVTRGRYVRNAWSVRNVFVYLFRP